MNLLQLQQLADEAYGDGAMTPYYNQKTGKPVMDPNYGGDTLAKFVAIELAETFEPDDPEEHQLQEAFRVMETAQGEIGDVIAAILNKLRR